MTAVPRIHTPATELELADALYVGHSAAFGSYPSGERLLCALAQSALELGRGLAIWNNNIGNITASSKWLYDYYTLRVPPPDPPELKFRSHTTLLDGATDYWRVLSGKTFGSAVPFFDRGDPHGAAMDLGVHHWFLANPDKYALGMVGLYHEYLRRGLDQAELRAHADVPSAEELASTGRLWRLAEDVDAGVEGLPTG